jgi:hypothetical protein
MAVSYIPLHRTKPLIPKACVKDVVTNPPMLWITLLKVGFAAPEGAVNHGFLEFAQFLGNSHNYMILLNY